MKPKFHNLRFRVMAILLVIAADFSVSTDAANKFVLSEVGTPDVANLIFSARSPGGYEPWSLVWNFADLLNYTRATLSFSGTEPWNDIYTPHWHIAIEHVVDGTPTLVSSAEGTTGISVNGRPNTLKLMVDNHSARLHAGETSTTEIATVPFTIGRPGFVGILADEKNAGTFTTTIAAVAKPSAEFPCEFENISQLSSYLAESHDSREGVWRYLDRDTDDSIALPDGQYTLATIHDNHGGYYILYLNGALSGASRWQPLQLKGQLIPTSFPDVYDLVWRDSNGVERAAEQNAAFTSDHTLLTLRFPLLSATLRLSKSASR